MHWYFENSVFEPPKEWIAPQFLPDLSEAKERHYISTHSNVEKLNEWGRENIAERIYLNYQMN